MPDLVPAPLSDLLKRAYYEPNSQQTIYDLPLKDVYRGSSSVDFSTHFHGLSAGTPLGPAAGPQDQLTQNIVLAWLGGSRIIELKTVQILDELVINRPCIDATNIGFHIERADGSERIIGRIKEKEYWLELMHANDAAIFNDGVVVFNLQLSTGKLLGWKALDQALAKIDPAREPFEHIPDHVVSMVNYYRLRTLLHGVLDTKRVNYVNAHYM